MRRRGVGGAGHVDGLDHLAAAEERRQLGEQLVAAPQHADAGRAVQLVTGEGEEVGAELLHVERQVRHRLRGVDHRQRADRTRARDDARDTGLIVPSALDWWTKATTLVRSLIDLVDRRVDQPALVVDRDAAERRAGALAPAAATARCCCGAPSR